MASIKPRKRGESCLKELDDEMKRTFSMKMGHLKRLKRDVHEDDPDSGVIFISHIPHGFFEPQMKKFFSQFGNIKRLRLSRSKKSGRSRGYAYIEFEFSEVAKVVAETMHNYLMYQKLLKCFYVPKEKLHPNTFKGCFRHFKRPRRREIAAARNNGLLESRKEHILERQKRRVRSLAKKQQQLTRMGIEYKMDGLESELDRLKACPLPERTSGKKKLENATPVNKTTRKAGKAVRRTRKRQKRTAADAVSKAAPKPTKKQTANAVQETVTKAAPSKKTKKAATPKELEVQPSAQTSPTKVPAVKAKREVKSVKVPSKTRSRTDDGKKGKKAKRLSL